MFLLIVSYFNYFIAIFACFAFLPSMLHCGKDEFSIARAVSDSVIDADFRVKLFQTDIMRSKLKKLLPKFDHKGLLDDM